MAQFLVNRVSINPAPISVEYQGQMIPAIVDQLEVELVDETGLHGSICLRYRTNDEKDAARAKYVPGTLVDIAI